MTWCRSRVAMGLCIALIGGLLMVRYTVAQNSSTPPASGQPKTSIRSRTFRLYQEKKFEGVDYYIDGIYTVRPGEAVVTIQDGPVVAHRTVILHSLRLGICGTSNMFSRELLLNDASLKPNDSYKLPSGTISVPLPKSPPAPSWLCSAPAESTGEYHVARDKGPAILIPSESIGKPHPARDSGRPTSIPSVATPHVVAEAWKHKNPADWSDRETQDFLTDSPWAHLVVLHIPSDVMRPNGRPWSIFEERCVVRWESAALVRDALARIESKEYSDALVGFSKDYYVIAVIHLMKGTGPAGLSSHWTREQEEELRNAGAAQAGQRGTLSQSIPMQTPHYWEARQVFLSSLLLRSGYDAISPARVECRENAEGWVDLLMFPRDLALEKSEGDIDVKAAFQAGMGLSTVTVRFSLKDLAGGSERGL